MALWSVLTAGQDVLRPEEAACLKVEGAAQFCHSVVAFSTATHRTTSHSLDIARGQQFTDSPSAIRSEATHQVALTIDTEVTLVDVS